MSGGDGGGVQVGIVAAIRVTNRSKFGWRRGGGGSPLSGTLLAYAAYPSCREPGRPGRILIITSAAQPSESAPRPASPGLARAAPPRAARRWRRLDPPARRRTVDGVRKD